MKRAALWIAAALIFAAVVLWLYPRQPSVEAATPSYNPKTGDPCALNVRSSVPINLTAGGQLVTGVSGKQTYVCGMLIVNAAAQNIALVEGTGSTCGTNTAGMAGGATAATGWNLGVNQVVAFSYPGAWSIVTATAGDNVCLLLSGSTQVSGYITVAQQ